VVNEHLCYSFNDRVCGVCYYACPFPNKALRLGLGARPEIIEEACVGCGNCERACIHLPQAVRITPTSARRAAA
jgi:NAD-dependent dihydropyrimidine dehydrogenase PreA subunit